MDGLLFLLDMAGNTMQQQQAAITALQAELARISAELLAVRPDVGGDHGDDVV